MVVKFPCKILIASLLTHSWTGGGGVALIKSNIFQAFFMKIEQISISFSSHCSYYEKYLGTIAFFDMLPEWSRTRGEKKKSCDLLASQGGSHFIYFRILFMVCFDKIDKIITLYCLYSLSKQLYLYIRRPCMHISRLSKGYVHHIYIYTYVCYTNMCF